MTETELLLDVQLSEVLDSKCFIFVNVWFVVSLSIQIQNAIVCVCKASAVIKLEIASDKTLNTTIIRVLKLMKPSKVTMDLKQLLMESLSQAKATKPRSQSEKQT